MEQLRQLGEVVGAIDALMAFEPELRVNPRQCRLLADACARALAAVTGEVRAHLRFEERGAKWRAVEPALRELHRAFRDAEGYVRQCLHVDLSSVSAALDWVHRLFSLQLNWTRTMLTSLLFY